MFPVEVAQAQSLQGPVGVLAQGPDDSLTHGSHRLDSDMAGQHPDHDDPEKQADYDPECLMFFEQAYVLRQQGPVDHLSHQVSGTQVAEGYNDGE